MNGVFVKGLSKGDMKTLVWIIERDMGKAAERRR